VTWLVFVLLAQAADPAPPKDTLQSAMAKQRAAAAIQREAVRKQAEMTAAWLDAGPPAASATTGTETSGAAAATMDCDPIGDPFASALVGSAAAANQLDPKLLSGLIRQESRFRPCAVSVKGARGLMQLMPATIAQFNVADPFDPRQNVDAGAKYLRQLLDKYKGDVSLALAAYNAGPTTVDEAGGIPNIKETRDYVDNILKRIRPPAN
jgi:soluble lytic murein transglycosylase-like protein